MAEIIKMPENSELNVDERVLTEVVEEILAEKGKEEILGTGFFWLAVHLYREKMNINKLNETQVNQLHRKITPVLIKIFREKHRAISGVKYADEESAPDRTTPRWLKEEIAREGRTESPPRFTI